MAAASQANAKAVDGKKEQDALILLRLGLKYKKCIARLVASQGLDAHAWVTLLQLMYKTYKAIQKMQEGLSQLRH